MKFSFLFSFFVFFFLFLILFKILFLHFNYTLNISVCCLLRIHFGTCVHFPIRKNLNTILKQKPWKHLKKKNTRKKYVQYLTLNLNCYIKPMLSLCIFAINSNSVLNLASGSGTTSSLASTPLPSPASALAQSSRFCSHSGRLNIAVARTQKHTKLKVNRQSVWTGPGHRQKKINITKKQNK